MSIEELAKLPQQLISLQKRVIELESMMKLYIESIDPEVDTNEALKITGIKSRDTLTRERDRPGTLLRYCKHGTSVSYSRKSCIDYKLARQLGIHRAPVMWAAAS